ncbi:MAG: DsbA family protein [Candidatus Aenigmarchaeota archaeon]|nr:DsbA family protein [Candidatus Aenigmarchaeota archaeon]
MSNRCEPCNKDFESMESLQQHKLAKHTTTEKTKSGTGNRLNKKYGFLIVIILIVAISGTYFGLSQGTGYVFLSEYTEHSKGSGQIEVVEYSDFQCPACGAAYPEVKNIISQAEDKVKVIYKQLPLTSIHPYAFKAAEASECAADQGKFWEYHNKLFDNQNKLDVVSLKKYAADIGLDTVNFNACLDTGATAGRVRADMEEAKSKGVRATPTFFVNGKKHEGVLTLQKLLELAASL